MMSTLRSSSLVSVAFSALVVASIAGCSAAPTETAAATETESPVGHECLAVAEKAVNQQETLYATHPLWDMEMPGVDALPEEQEKFDALTADEEIQ